MKTVTVKEKVKSLSKKQLIAVALHFIEKSGTDPNSNNDGGCGLTHEGECGVCINNVWIAC